MKKAIINYLLLVLMIYCIGSIVFEFAKVLNKESVKRKEVEKLEIEKLRLEIQIKKLQLEDK